MCTNESPYFNTWKQSKQVLVQETRDRNPEAVWKYERDEEYAWIQSPKISP